jgi:O-methyltransferase
MFGAISPAFGCFDGKTAVIYQKVLDEFGSDRRLHLYDHFRVGFHLQGRDIRAEVERNFRDAGVRPPLIHEGDFHQTIPSALPAEIACMDIDCGYGGDPDLHEVTMLHLLEHIYPRMTAGAIGILMDYHEPARSPCRDCSPGVGRACRKFFANRAEKVSPIWAGEYPQGYFRKR